MDKKKLRNIIIAFSVIAFIATTGFFSLLRERNSLQLELGRMKESARDILRETTATVAARLDNLENGASKEIVFTGIYDTLSSFFGKGSPLSTAQIALYGTSFEPYADTYDKTVLGFIVGLAHREIENIDTPLTAKEMEKWLELRDYLSEIQKNAFSSKSDAEAVGKMIFAAQAATVDLRDLQREKYGHETISGVVHD